MSDRYPEIEPYQFGFLDVGDGHTVYWEASGNPDGRAAVYLHGGPGSGSSPGARRYVDPETWRIVCFDQRGAGRSRPLASDPDADLSTNTTRHLIADIERLRQHLGIDRWTVFGVSWGATLAQAYAHAHPDRVDAIVLALVTTTSHREVRWVTEEMGRVFPREWDRFAGFVPERLRGMPLVDAYAELLFDPDPEIVERTAIEWCRWEDTHVSLAPDFQPNERYEDPEFRLRFARLVTHYWRHAAFLEEDQLLRDAAKLNGIPGVLIHGRYDVSSPLEIPWRLSQRWETSRLHVLGDMGHGGGSFAAAVTGAFAELSAR
jgi:proline iminopeptidase